MKMSPEMRNLAGLESQKVTGVEQAEFTRPVQIQINHVGEGLNTGQMVPTCTLLRREAQLRDSGSHCPEATQLSLHLCVFLTARVAIPLSKPRVSTCE